MDFRLEDNAHIGSWILAKFFYPPDYLGFETNLESILEITSFSILLVLLLLPIYNSIFHQTSIQVKLEKPVYIENKINELLMPVKMLKCRAVRSTLFMCCILCLSHKI